MQATERISDLPNKSFFAMNRWFHKLYLVGLLYNVDDPAETIVKISTGKPVFTPEECIKPDKAVDLMFEYHGDKVYDVCLEYFYKAIGITPDYSEA